MHANSALKWISGQMVVQLQHNFRKRSPQYLIPYTNKGLRAKEVELEISTGSHDLPPAMQKVSAVINTIREQGFEVKELEVDAEKEE